MSKKRFASGEVSLTAVISLTLWNAHVQAQEDAGRLKLEEVVVTGSFIPTLPEDAAIPVEVINYEDIQNMGRPSNLDLIKSLTEVGQIAGELDRNNGYPIDAATVNLRNLGPRFTTVVFNNRRFPEQFSPGVGRFNNIASIPNAAIGNVEVLRSGGAAIYGADAVAGVVNYITRKDVNGLELNAEYRYIDDSDGDYNVDGIWGTTFEGGNLIVSAAYQHRSKLAQLDRDFSDKEYLENPVGWNTIASPGAYGFQRPLGAANTQTTLTPGAGGYVGQRQMGVSGYVREPACQDLGGFAGWSGTQNAACYMPVRLVEPLTEESDQYSLFAEYNQRVGELSLHLEGLAYYRDLPEINVTTRGFPQTFPLDGSVNAAGQYTRTVIGTTAAYAVSGRNPAVADFLNSFRNPDGTTAFTAAQIAAITNPANPGRAMIPLTYWIPFTVGGHPLGQDFDYQRNTTTQWRLSGSIGGELPSFWGTELEWELALTYHYTKDTRWTRDVFTNRLQNALNGFGGPNCTENPITGTPGAPGCFFLNPFASSIARNIYTGEVNPYFVGTGNFTGYLSGAGLQNTPDVVRWLYQPISLDRYYYNYIVDPIIRGRTGIELPGGNMMIALGGQYRRQDEHTDLDDLTDREINPCPFLPDGSMTTNCAATARSGVFAFSRAPSVLGSAGANNNTDAKRHFPVAAGFLQFQLPILSNLNMDLVGRYEKFYSDLTDKDNDVAVPAVAVKWDPVSWLGLRASYGLTFSQVNPPAPGDPVVANGLTAGVNYITNNYPNVEVGSEDGENFAAGFVIQAGNFRATLDYNAITIENFARTLTANNVVTALLMPGELVSDANALINCSSDLLRTQVTGLGGRPFVELNGPCIQGASRLNSPVGAGGLGGGIVNFFGGQGQTNAGELISNAVDLTMSYTFENTFGGMLIPSLNVTYITKYEFSDFVVKGVTVAPGYDGKGFRNASAGRLGQGVPEYRAGFGVLYRKDRHTVNLMARYVPSVINEEAADFNATIARNANIGPTTGGAGCTGTPTLSSDLGGVPDGAGTAEFGTFCSAQNVATLAGRKIDSYFNLDFIYRVELLDNLDVTLAVSNVTDEDPSFARTQIAYDSGYGSPLGRTVELGASVKF